MKLTNQYIDKLLSDNRIVKHVIFWLGFITFYTMSFGSINEQYKIKFLHTLLILPFILAATYYSVYILVEKYLNQKKYLSFILLFLISSTLLATAYMLFFKYVSRIYLDINNNCRLDCFLIGFVHIYSVVTLFFVLKALKDGIKLREQAHILHQEKLAAELKYLKGQIHPHFLFNTLNNLYSLALDKHEKTADGILKLSSLLNFMLYESNIERILLSKELNLINNYINLEKLRYGDRLIISFDIKGDTSSVEIAPLLLLPFIENAFKHGASQKREENWIVILLEITDKDFIFSIENTKNQASNNKKESYKQGIGLKNTKRRLELLYPDKYTLDITDKGDTYFIKLQLNYRPS